MTGVRVKICGINDPAAFDTAVAAGADYVGLNFFPPSPRYVTPAQAAALSARHSGGPLRVGLFVDPTAEAIAATLDVVRLDILQLYGRLDIGVLRARFGLPVWRGSVSIRSRICRMRPAVPTRWCWRRSRRQPPHGPAAMPCSSTGRCCATGLRRHRGFSPVD